MRVGHCQAPNRKPPVRKSRGFFFVHTNLLAATYWCSLTHIPVLRELCASCTKLPGAKQEAPGSQEPGVFLCTYEFVGSDLLVFAHVHPVLRELCTSCAKLPGAKLKTPIAVAVGVFLISGSDDRTPVTKPPLMWEIKHIEGYPFLRPAGQ